MSHERRLRVAEVLVNNLGDWVPGYNLTGPEVGGSEGLRRLRELRDDYGYLIEKRKMTNSTAYEYRLIDVE